MYFKYDDADATFQQIPTGLILAANNPLGAPAGTPVDALLAPQFASGAPLAAQKVKTRIMHPAQVQFGFGYSGFDSTTISLDYAWVGWKAFKELPVDFQGGATDRVLLENYNNTSALRLGVEHRYIERRRDPRRVSPRRRPPRRTSPSRRSSPSRIAPTAPSAAAIPITKTFSVDGAYSHIFTPGRRGRIDERTSLLADRRPAQQRRVYPAREHLLDQPQGFPLIRARRPSDV